MSFEQTMTLAGMILQVIIMVMGGLYALSKLDIRLNLVAQETAMRHIANQEKFIDIAKKLDELVTYTVQIARQEVRMNSLDERMLELSNRLAKLNGNYFKPTRQRNKG